MAAPIPLSARSAWASLGADLGLGVNSSSAQQSTARRRSIDVVSSAARPPAPPPPPPLGRRISGVLVANNFNSRPTARSEYSTSTAHRSQHHRRHSRGARRRHFATAAADVARVQQNAASIEIGALVEFKRPNGYVLGLVMASGPARDSWQVEDKTGVLYSVKERDVVYVLPGSDYSASDLNQIATKAESNQDPSLLSVAWEISEPGTAVYSVEEMADLLFGDNSPASCAASHRLLRDDKLYFKQAGRSPPMYTARPASQVAALKQQAAAENAAAETLAKFVASVEAAKKLPRKQKPTKDTWLAEEHAAKCTLLENFALGRPMVHAGQATATLKGCGVAPTPQGAAEVLQSAGYWPPHVQLGLLASNMTERFTPELESAAQDLLASPPPDPDAALRQNLSHLHVVTIDDASTTEIDDGLSAEMLPDGNTQVWVHIADPTRWIDPGSALDVEARRRSKTLYLPTGMVPMFPLSLAEGPFSLRQGEESHALTVTAVIDNEGQLLPGTATVMPSLVTPTLRLTYDHVDEMLEECDADQEPALHALAKVSAARRVARTAAGAVDISMPETKLDVDDASKDDPAVSIEASDPTISQSRQLVAEMMILAGEIAATLGAEKRIPLPYRGQNDPILPTEEELESIPEGPCRMTVLRTCMTRSITVADAPARHAGLGLDGYVQITSPIRRYGDLLAHWQLKAALRGDKTPFSVSSMTEELNSLANTTQYVSKLERDAQSYWLAVYFKHVLENQGGGRWEATFLTWFKQEAGLGRVLLEKLGLETIVKLTRPAVPGTVLNVKCISADPLLGMYRLEEANEE